MTQEEKELLLIDLCARLPYEVKVDHFGVIRELLEVIPSSENVMVGYDINDYEDSVIEDIKPYLRSMSSMSEEEMEELKQEHLKDEKLYAECLTKAAQGDNSMRGKVIVHFAADWCNKNHFDYRGLIPMGLALEAKEGMYKTK